MSAILQGLLSMMAMKYGDQKINEMTAERRGDANEQAWSSPTNAIQQQRGQREGLLQTPQEGGLLGNLPGLQGLPEGQQRAMRGLIRQGQFDKVAAGLTPASGVGQFKDMNEYLKALQTTRKDAGTQLSPSRESLRKFGQATELVSKRGGFANMNGADDTVLMKAFASMILPGEAVMSDDIRIIADQGGLPDWFKGFAAQLTGGGTLSPDQRSMIYNTMQPLGQIAFDENSQIRGQYQTDIDFGQFPINAVFKEQIKFNPYTGQPMQPTPAAKTPQKTESKLPPGARKLSPEEVKALGLE